MEYISANDIDLSEDSEEEKGDDEKEEEKKQKDKEKTQDLVAPEEKLSGSVTYQDYKNLFSFSIG